MESRSNRHGPDGDWTNSVTRFAPTPELAEFVRCFEIVEATEEMTRTLFPEPSVVMGFRYAGASALVDADAVQPVPDRVLTGLRATVRRMRTAARSGIVLAKLRPAGTSAFFDVPLQTLFGQTLALEDLVTRVELERISSEVAEAAGPQERVAAVERFLLGRLRPGAVDPLVRTVLRAIQAAPGGVRIAELARAHRLSQDALEKRFRRAVGAPPKRFASLLRLQQALALRRSGRSLSELAIAAGYYDQSHFIREFKAVTGEPPQRFLRSAEYC